MAAACPGQSTSLVVFAWHTEETLCSCSTDCTQHWECPVATFISVWVLFTLAAHGPRELRSIRLPWLLLLLVSKSRSCALKIIALMMVGYVNLYATTTSWAALKLDPLVGLIYLYLMYPSVWCLLHCEWAEWLATGFSSALVWFFTTCRISFFVRSMCDVGVFASLKFNFKTHSLSAAL